MIASFLFVKNPPSPLQILLVEDDAPGRQAFCRAMKEGGVSCKITECSRAGEALERIETAPSPFDLWVVDHLLPGMSGLALCRQAAMRKTPSPLLFLIPAGSEALAAAAIKAGATAYIIKDPSCGYLNLLPVAVPEAVKRYRDRLAHTETEAVLRESEAKYRFITETMLDMVWIVGLDFHTTYVSPSVERVLGFTPEERKQQAFKENVTPEAYQRVLEKLAEELRRNHENAPDPDRSVVIEVEYYRKDGATLWMENRVQAIRDSENAMVGIMGVSRDITERREAEAALRESEKKYRTLFENAPIGIGITDGVGNILDYNEAMFRLYGYEKEDTLPSGRTVDYYHNPEERERIVTLLLRDGFVDREEVYLKRKDGTPYHGLLSMRPVEMGGKSCWLSITQDVSERKQIEKDLQGSRREWEEIFQTIGQPTLILDEDRHILKANKAILKITGKREGKIVGKRCYEVLHKGRIPEGCPFEKMLASGRLETSEMEVAFLKGIFLISCTPIFDPKGRLEKVIHTATDITDRKAQETFMALQRDLSTTLASAGSLPEAFDGVLAAVLQLEGVDCGGIYSVNPQTNGLDLVVHKGCPDRFVEAAAHFERDSPQGRMVVEGNPIYGLHLEIAPAMDAVRLDEGIRTLAVIPVKNEGDVIAALNLGSHAYEEFPEKTRRAAEIIAAQIGSAVARIQAEASLKESQRNLQALFDTLDDFLFILNGAGNIVYVNPVVKDRLGYSLETLTHMNVLDVHPPERRAEAAEIVGRHRRGH